MTIRQIWSPDIIYIDNLQLRWLTVTTFRVSAGRARDIENTFDLVLDEDVTVDMNREGRNGYNPGGTTAYTFLGVYLIGDSTGYQDECIVVSDSPTKPTLLPGYNVWRRIGFVYQGALGQVYEFIQTGGDTNRWMYFRPPNPLLIGGDSTIWQYWSMSEVIPTYGETTRLSVVFEVEFTADSDGDKAHFRPLNSLDDFGYRYSPGAAGTGIGVVQMPIVSNDDGEFGIEYKVTDGNDNLDVYVSGYQDILI